MNKHYAKYTGITDDTNYELEIAFDNTTNEDSTIFLHLKVTNSKMVSDYIKAVDKQYLIDMAINDGNCFAMFIDNCFKNQHNHTENLDTIELKCNNSFAVLTLSHKNIITKSFTIIFNVVSMVFIENNQILNNIFAVNNTKSDLNNTKSDLNNTKSVLFNTKK